MLAFEAAYTEVGRQDASNSARSATSSPARSAPSKASASALPPCATQHAMAECKPTLRHQDHRCALTHERAYAQNGAYRRYRFEALAGSAFLMSFASSVSRMIRETVSALDSGSLKRSRRLSLVIVWTRI